MSGDVLAMILGFALVIGIAAVIVMAAAREQKDRAQRQVEARQDPVAALQRCLVTTATPPELRTVNGIGASVFGSFQTDELSPLKFKFLCFCFLFIPVIPDSIWLVEGFGGSYRFYGRLKTSDFVDIYGWYALALLFASAVIEGIVRMAVLIAILVAAFFIYSAIRERGW